MSTTNLTAATRPIYGSRRNAPLAAPQQADHIPRREEPCPIADARRIMGARPPVAFPEAPIFTRPGPFRFGTSSTAQLETLHADLRRLLERAIEVVDFTVTEGRRSIETQIVYLRRGVTRTIDSRHIPRDDDGEYDPDGLADAVDLTPYQPGVNPWPLPGDTPDVVRKKVARFYFLQGILYALAREEGIDVRLGVDWDSDLDFFDQTFDDLGHVELRTPRVALRVPEDLRDDVDAALALL